MIKAHVLQKAAIWASLEHCIRMLVSFFRHYTTIGMHAEDWNGSVTLHSLCSSQPLPENTYRYIQLPTGSVYLLPLRGGSSL